MRKTILTCIKKAQRFYRMSEAFTYFKLQRDDLAQRREDLGKKGCNTGLRRSSARAAPLKCARRCHQSVSTVTATAEDTHTLHPKPQSLAGTSACSKMRGRSRKNGFVWKGGRQ